MLQEHKAGDRIFVDYAGQTVPVELVETGETREAHVFVAVLGASSYFYAEASWGEDLESWIGSHVRALEDFGGAGNVCVPGYVPSPVMWPKTRSVEHVNGSDSGSWRYSESSHSSRSGVLRQPPIACFGGSPPTGGRHVSTAAILVRMPISA